MMRALVVYRELPDAERYAAALRLVGVEPLLAQANAGTTIGDCAGLLLTGGTDVNPALYGESRISGTDEPDDERDHAEAALIDEALARNLPLLAICRGMQMLNVHLGGTLIQHLPTTEHHRRRTPQRGLPAHTVQIEAGTRLSAVAGVPAWQVNSRHHQALNTLGNGLTVSARDPEDSVIEAVEMPAYRYVIALQWHPEDQAQDDPEQRKLFESFRDALQGSGRSAQGLGYPPNPVIGN